MDIATYIYNNTEQSLPRHQSKPLKPSWAQRQCEKDKSTACINGIFLTVYCSPKVAVAHVSPMPGETPSPRQQNSHLEQRKENASMTFSVKENDLYVIQTGCREIWQW